MNDTYNPNGNKKSRKQVADEATPLAAARIEEPPAAARADPGAKRIEEIRARRKERGPMDISGFTQKLSVSEERKDKRYVYRWALDAANRIHDLKAKDWDPAPLETTAGDQRDMNIGTVIERIGNVRTVPSPERHVLMRKPKEFYEEDKSKEQTKIKQDEKALTHGIVRARDGQEGLSGPDAYIPQGTGISIEHG